jgi:hypothetical protein
VTLNDEGRQIPYTMRGFATADDASAASTRVAQTINEIVKELHLSIAGLDGVTIAVDYDDALTQLDRGVIASTPLSRTRDDVADGCAMAPLVRRNGRVMSHLVLAAFVVPLIDAPQMGVSGKYIIGHELSHVHEHYFRDRGLPDVLLNTTITKADEAVLFDTADNCWSEYAACCLSATLNPEQMKLFEMPVVSLLRKAKDEIRGAKRDWVRDRDFGKVWKRIVTVTLSLLKYFSYFLGHAAGLDKPAEDLAPDVFDLLQSSPWLLPWIQKLKETLVEMFDTFDMWKGLDVFDPLKQIARGLLKVCGITIRDSNGSLFVIVDSGTPLVDGV